jgi:hypothetical protein
MLLFRYAQDVMVIMRNTPSWYYPLRVNILTSKSNRIKFVQHVLWWVLAAQPWHLLVANAVRLDTTLQADFQDYWLITKWYLFWNIPRQAPW